MACKGPFGHRRIPLSRRNQRAFRRHDNRGDGANVRVRGSHLPCGAFISGQDAPRLPACRPCWYLQLKPSRAPRPRLAKHMLTGTAAKGGWQQLRLPVPRPDALVPSVDGQPFYRGRVSGRPMPERHATEPGRGLLPAWRTRHQGRDDKAGEVKKISASQSRRPTPCRGPSAQCPHPPFRRPARLPTPILALPSCAPCEWTGP